MHYLCLESKGSDDAERPFYLGVLQGFGFLLPGDRMLRRGVSIDAQLPRGGHVCGSALWPASRAPPGAVTLRGGAPVLPLLAWRRCHSASPQAAYP